MGYVRIQGYHTCEASGGKQHILDNAPFKSEANNRQWLTQGYYFWTDSEHFAHKWGQDSIKGDYAIIQCAIEMKKKHLLDLVGSVEDQLHFEKMLKRFERKLQDTGVKQKATVSAVLDFYRKHALKNVALFPYKAIKAQDNYQQSTVAFLNSKNAYLPLITRQQLCLFDGDCIKTKTIIYPASFR